MEQKYTLEIIDWARKGNVVRLFLGKNGKQYGDDWNDVPYEHNAGPVYDQFIVGVKDIKFDFDDTVLEPRDYVSNSKYSKEDMVKRKTPFLTVTKLKDLPIGSYDFETSLKNDDRCKEPKARRFYFGDKVDV